VTGFRLGSRLHLRNREDRALADLIRGENAALGTGPANERALFARAERHGLAGVLLDMHRASGRELPADLSEELALREVARECDHAAHLAMLRRIDEILADRGIRAVALKGALLAERLYDRPAARPTTDVDVLVAHDDLDAAAEALRVLGYEPSRAPSEARFRAEGHHIHLVRPDAPCIELHFHAFRGFGSVLRSEPLVERSVEVPALAFRSLRALSPADELVYLAVHAASHRFMRLGWLYDLWLLRKKVNDDVVACAFERAREARMARPFAFALELQAELFGSTVDLPQDALRVRRRLLGAITEEPSWPIARSATRFAYSMALCEDWEAMVAYARSAIRSRLSKQA